ncbi:MAG: pentapeptide repeat-containing protein [Opitutales bacterium]
MKNLEEFFSDKFYSYEAFIEAQIENFFKFEFFSFEYIDFSKFTNRLWHTFMRDNKNNRIKKYLLERIPIEQQIDWVVKYPLLFKSSTIDKWTAGDFEYFHKKFLEYKKENGFRPKYTARDISVILIYYPDLADEFDLDKEVVGYGWLNMLANKSLLISDFFFQVDYSHRPWLKYDPSIHTNRDDFDFFRNPIYRNLYNHLVESPLNVYDTNSRSKFYTNLGNDKIFIDIMLQYPEMAYKMDIEAFHYEYQSRFVKRFRGFADKFVYNNLVPMERSFLLGKFPELIDFLDYSDFDSSNWCGVLSENPQLAKFANWEIIEGRDCVCILKGNPEIANLIKWENFDGFAWQFLLTDSPKYAKHCDWNKLNSTNWSVVLKARPEFAEYANWDKITPSDISSILDKRPMLKKFIDKDILFAIETRNKYVQEAIDAVLNDSAIKIEEKPSQLRDLKEYYGNFQDLAAQDFSSCNLFNASFISANLRGADFSGSLLDNASFCDANIEKADFSGATIENADFSNLFVSENQLDDTVDFRKKCLKKVSFFYSHLEKISFRDMTLIDICFEEANLTDAKFLDCTLRNVEFEEANLKNACFRACDLRTCLDLDLSKAFIEKSILPDGTLVGSKSYVPRVLKITTVKHPTDSKLIDAKVAAKETIINLSLHIVNNAKVVLEENSMLVISATSVLRLDLKAEEEAKIFMKANSRFFFKDRGRMIVTIDKKSRQAGTKFKIIEFEEGAKLDIEPLLARTNPKCLELDSQLANYPPYAYKDFKFYIEGKFLILEILPILKLPPERK